MILYSCHFVNCFQAVFVVPLCSLLLLLLSSLVVWWFSLVVCLGSSYATILGSLHVHLFFFQLFWPLWFLCYIQIYLRTTLGYFKVEECNGKKYRIFLYKYNQQLTYPSYTWIIIRSDVQFSLYSTGNIKLREYGVQSFLWTIFFFPLSISASLSIHDLTLKSFTLKSVYGILVCTVPSNTEFN